MKAINTCPFCLCGVHCPPATHDDEDETNHFDYDPNFFECLYGFDCSNRFKYQISKRGGICWLSFQLPPRYQVQICYQTDMDSYGTVIYGLTPNRDVSLEDYIHIKTPFNPDFKNIPELKSKIKMLAAFS